MLLGLIELTWIKSNPSSNDMPSKVRGEITFPFPNFNGAAVQIFSMWIYRRKSAFAHAHLKASLGRDIADDMPDILIWRENLVFFL